jgi:hypothetical protein
MSEITTNMDAKTTTLFKTKKKDEFRWHPNRHNPVVRN